jgi:hypothetical protein
MALLPLVDVVLVPELSGEGSDPLVSVDLTVWARQQVAFVLVSGRFWANWHLCS